MSLHTHHLHEYSSKTTGHRRIQGLKSLCGHKLSDVQISRVKLKPAALLEPTQKQAGDQDVGKRSDGAAHASEPVLYVSTIFGAADCPNVSRKEAA